MKYLLIVNPNSGSFIGKKNIDALQLYFKKNNIETDLYLSEYKNSITDYCIKNKDTYDNFIVVGGDGAINETIQLAKYKSFNLGVIPAGTANVLAKEFSISEKKIFKAADIIIRGKTIKIDTWRADNRIFLLMLSGGIDSAALENLNLKFKKIAGKTAYVYQFFKEALLAKKKNYILDFNEKIIITKQFFLMNISKYAGNYIITDNTEYTDNTLELIYFKDYSLLKLLRWAFNVFFNFKTEHLRYIKKELCAELMIKPENSIKLPLQFDGDSGLYAPLTVKHNNQISIFI